MARAGRRPGPTGTRDDILAAARKLFGDKGYDGTTVRAIAAEAGVNPALVHHFFGTKDRVFIAALELPINPVELIVKVADGPRERMGERLVRTFLGAWRDPEVRAPFVALLRSVAGKDQPMMREFMATALLGRVSDTLGIPRLRLSAVVGQMFGIAVLRYVVRLEPLASASEEDIVAMVAPTVQRYLDG